MSRSFAVSSPTVILSEAKDLCSWSAQVRRSFASLKMIVVNLRDTKLKLGQEFGPPHFNSCNFEDANCAA